ncbi:acetate/propionate family kinase [Thalassotalea crassostreae]|uniref:acetate/propionate family kinase n=1 Tax=Thalassotalea crassostreae TaxID=1763536 RepID=UPI0008390BD4|nr:acetate kinase [Thalassotalea crassostreae]
MNKNIVLVINCGSSSLKFSLIDPKTTEELVSGIGERLLSNDAVIKFKANGTKQTFDLPAPFDHQTAVAALVDYLQQNNLQQDVIAVGHRIVHGGEKYSQPILINSDVKQTIKELSKLAPLHNPVNLIGVEAAERAFAGLPQVAVFDTAFHQTMPEKAFLYGIPYVLYKDHGIRSYGFHGTSHYYVSNQAAQMLGKKINNTSVIAAHLGNGCSVTAVKDGKSVDCSMGFTPLAGVMMGTRSGDIDPGIIFHLVDQLNYSVEQVSAMLNKESGLLGVSQMSNDCRTIEQAIFDSNDPQATLAMDIFSYRIAKSIASLTASLTNLDALVFTGGIGENSAYVREQVVASLKLLNIVIDDAKNQEICFGKSGNIAQASSTPCLVIPTNEELVIAEQSYQLLQEGK